MFRYRRQRRHWSAWVLLLWFFGIGSAFANSCLTGNAAGHGAPADMRYVAMHATDPLALVSPIDALHSATAVHQHGGMGDGPAPSKTNCQDFCDKSTISIPPLKKALDHGDTGPAHPPPLAALRAVAAREPVQRRVASRGVEGARPITIAFLRLAL